MQTCFPRGWVDDPGPCNHPPDLATCPHPFVTAPASTIYLLRHAESAPSRDLPEPDWPLSRRGADQARRWATHLSGLDIARVSSSPFLRAVATVRPFCEARQLPIEIEPDLR